MSCHGVDTETTSVKGSSVRRHGGTEVYTIKEKREDLPKGVGRDGYHSGGKWVHIYEVNIVKNSKLRKKLVEHTQGNLHPQTD